MRVPSRIAALILLALGSSGCASPLAGLAAAPVVAEAIRGPQALAVPTEEGSVYVLAEGGPMTSPLTLRSMWRRKAAQTCDGDYMVMSERDAQSRRAGVGGGRLHEGFVRCVSPEGAVPE